MEEQCSDNYSSNFADSDPSKSSKDDDSLNEEEFKIERNLKDQSKFDKSIKLIFLGESSVGKTSIIHRICQGEFSPNLKATISLELNNYYIKINDYIIRIQIWDTAGQEKYNSIVKNYFQNADIAIYIYAINDENSFEKIQDWYFVAHDNNQKAGNKEMKNILLGNKKDVGETQRKVSTEEGELFAKKNNFLYFQEISCKDSNEKEINNINKVFDIIAIQYFKNLNRRTFSTDSDSINFHASKKLYPPENKEQKNKKKRCCK